MSLLGDIWDGIVGKVRSLISSSLADFKSWVNARISDTIAAIQKVYNYVYNYVTNVYNNVTNYLTNVYNNVTNYVTNVVENVTKYITNITNNTSQYITNVIGASTEWVNNQLAGVRAYVDGRIAALDTVGFFKDPVKFILAAVAPVWLLNQTNAAESFMRGLEEGLTEEEA